VGYNWADNHVGKTFAAQTKGDETAVNQDNLRGLPAISALLECPQAQELIDRHGRGPALAALRSAVDELRSEITAGREAPKDMTASAMARAQEIAEGISRDALRPVINATGVIIHTNLGRSVLAEQAIQAVVRACRSYNNLEADLEQGRRSSRHVHVEQRLQSVIGAQAGAVFNNNAAAIMLALAALAAGREVIISRGQLIEIGGSFRMPEVIEQSGCILREVGATNRTHLRDYEAAINENTAAILLAHPSNYRIIGFTSEPETAHIAELAHGHGLPLLDDLGSGCLVDMQALGVGKEPTPQDSLGAGADIVTFSGDKLLGGPQCGIAVGRPELIDRMKKHPLARAVRVGKMTIAALDATLRILGDPQQAIESIPTLRAATEPLETVVQRAGAIAEGITRSAAPGASACVVTDRSARTGGGSLAEHGLETAAVRVVPPPSLSLGEVARRLRTGEPAVYSRTADDALVLDARTVLPHEVENLIAATRAALTVATPTI